MKKIKFHAFLLFIVLYLLFPYFISCDKENVSDKKSEDQLNIGAWYFGGWSFPSNQDGYSYHITPTLTTQFSYREPVWGWREDKMDVMTQQINYAADAGLSFWGFCWYENTLSPNPTFMDYLNTALDLFIKAPNKNRLNFFLLSSEPVSRYSWNTLCEKTIKLFSESNYLRVDGKPIIMFFNTDELIENLGGVSGIHEAFNIYREKARKAGIGEIMIGARTWPLKGDLKKYQERLESCGFDFLTTYHNGYNGDPGENDYEKLIQSDKWVWDKVPSNTALKYIPVLTTGYDMRPWAIDRPTLPASNFWFSHATPTGIANHLRDAIEWTKSNNNKVLNNMIIMYAWNENGEGGWLTPTKSEGNTRLEEIKKVIDEYK